MSSEVESLASYRRCVEHIQASWPQFVQRRREHLVQQTRFGAAAEKVAENVVEDLFTIVLDWPLTALNNQLSFADIVLTSQGVKYLIIEVKRPGALAWSRRAVESALAQARRYADEQKVKHVAISDGSLLYAADVVHGGLDDRVFARLDESQPDLSLWWLSEHGIYRERREHSDAVLRLLPDIVQVDVLQPVDGAETLLHPKYGVPATCFAYVGHAAKTGTWKLPFCCADGTIDLRRLPKAIQAILSNYRGVRVSGIPESDIPEVLVRLGRAAASLGKMPGQAGECAPIYQALADALDQEGRLPEVMGEL